MPKYKYFKPKEHIVILFRKQNKMMSIYVSMCVYIRGNIYIYKHIYGETSVHLFKQIKILLIPLTFRHMAEEEDKILSV